MGMEFAEVFVAKGPRPELAEEMALFAPLMGSWALRVFDYADDGTARESSAEWHFSWALDGRAVADVWINPARADRGSDGEGEWGLSLRFYDPAIRAWRSTWHGPRRGSVLPFTARASDDGIILSARANDIERLVETFTAPSWSEHLRTAARLTTTDARILAQAREFHHGDEPKLTAMLALKDIGPGR